LSGNVDIDTTTGIATDADLAVTGIPVHFTSILLQRTWPTAGPGFSPFLSEVIFRNGEVSGSNELILLFPPVSLIGYAGGILCGASTVCQDSQLQYFSNLNHVDSGGASTQFIDLVSGQLSAPEPATFSLFFGAITLAGFLRFARRRR